MSIDHPLVGEYEKNGEKYKLQYYEVANFDKIDLAKIRQIYGVCFCQDKLVVVHNGPAGSWGLAGGHPENGESIEETLKREVREEANMEIIRWRPIGIQEVTDSKGDVFYQLRVVCKVKPLGDFVEDMGGEVSEMKLIDPREYKEYFDWGEIGQKIMDRSVQLKSRL